IAAFFAALGTDHSGAIDHHYLGNVQNFVLPASQETVHVFFTCIAKRIVEFQGLGKEIDVGAAGIWSEGDGDGLKSARAQLAIQFVDGGGHTLAVLRADKEKLEDHYLAFETREQSRLAAGFVESEVRRFARQGSGGQQRRNSEGQ